MLLFSSIIAAECIVYSIIYVCMQMGKRRFHLSVQRKNDERKRLGFFPVRIPVKGVVSVFKVSVPLSSLTTHQRDLLTSTLPVPTSNPKSTSALPATPLPNALLTTPCINLCVNVQKHDQVLPPRLNQLQSSPPLL